LLVKSDFHFLSLSQQFKAVDLKVSFVIPAPATVGMQHFFTDGENPLQTPKQSSYLWRDLHFQPLLRNAVFPSKQAIQPTASLSLLISGGQLKFTLTKLGSLL